MKDIITHIPDLEKFRIEAAEIYESKGGSKEHHAAKFLFKDDSGNLIFNASKTPVVYQGNSSLCLVRTDRASDLDGTIDSLEVIGECVNGEYVFRPYGKDKYESTYQTDEVVTVSPDGIKATYKPPYMFGIFS